MIITTPVLISWQDFLSHQFCLFLCNQTLLSQGGNKIVCNDNKHVPMKWQNPDNSDILIKGIYLPIEQLTEFLGLPDGEHHSEDDLQSVTAQVFKHILKTKVRTRIS